MYHPELPTLDALEQGMALGHTSRGTRERPGGLMSQGGKSNW